MPDEELIFAADHPSATINSWERRGTIRRIARGIYTSTPASQASAETVIRRNWQTVTQRLTPGAVITDRSARTGAPVDGTLYVAHSASNRRIELPGLTIEARTGAGPQPGDIALPSGLHSASRERGLAENTTHTRSRGGRVRRTFNESELGDWVDEIARRDPDKLAVIRDRAEELAPALGITPSGIRVVSRQIGAAIGTQRVTTGSSALTARQTRAPYDQERIARFDRLRNALSHSAPQHHPFDHRNTNRYTFSPFFEAYFSNFIEGTEFEVDVAADIVFDDIIPITRPQDAHDILGTYAAVTNPDEMGRRHDTAADFIEALLCQHATIMGGRPDKRPGQFKQDANRAGNTRFVDPDLVEGTLIEGFARLDELDSGFERAVYMMFLVAEVHPFDDGNGRIARVMMNSELSLYGENRIIVPTVFRTNYLNGLRRMSREDDSSILIKALRYAHDYTDAIDFTDFDAAVAQLTATNAFEDADAGLHLIIPAFGHFDDAATIHRNAGGEEPTRRYTRTDGNDVARHHLRRPLR